MLNPDYHEILSAFSDEGVEYLIVGAYALAVHGVPRATGDIDLWIRRTEENTARVMRALESYGAGLDDFDEADFYVDGFVLQIGMAPRRIDILTDIDAVTFAQAWERRVEVDIEGLVVYVLSREDQIVNKRAAGRPQDIADANRLEGTRQ